MSNEQGTTPTPDSGRTVGGRPSQPPPEAGSRVSERKAFAKNAGLAAIGGAFSGAARGAAASIREMLLGDSTPD
ncbi:hypothetical protein [Streptomyces chartreusis]|uniref:hypothetical protein n=1 Tax=Streptomyces chartreusis TaxID=1969 RepID=UPI001679AD20|nr:hypothetical protein [Streptomyces chartreusis]GGX56132.1 hypothetical protein GCM10010321_86750 [Streptomyces chartreusis]